MKENSINAFNIIIFLAKNMFYLFVVLSIKWFGVESARSFP